MKTKYIKANFIPVFIELLFVLSCFIVEKQFYIYTNFCFYLVLVIFFYIRKDYSFKDWFSEIKSGKTFWKHVVITIIFFCLSFIFTTILENIVPNFDKGMIVLRADNWVKSFLLALSTIFFPPIVEETFYRKNLISFKNNKTLVITTLLAMFLYALEHSLACWGIFLCMIWALPLSISYIKTKNVHVTMTAHFICNLVINGITLVKVCKFLLS